MKNNEFRAPLMQSGALLVAIVFIISLIPSGDGMSVGSVIGAFVSGIFKLILYIIALAIAIAVSIAALIGIFIAAIALQSPEQASTVYAETKVRIRSLLQNSLATRSISTESTDTGISQEEYDQMKSTISKLQNANNELQSDVSSLNAKNSQLQDDIHGLNSMVDELKDSEAKITSLIADLSAKVESEPDNELKGQIQQLEEIVKKTNENIADLSGRLESLEEAATEPSPAPQTGGIFSYFETEDEKGQLIKAVEEGISKDLTYAQFDEFLTETLPAELDTIVKDHPSLTKDYIRSMRK